LAAYLQQVTVLCCTRVTEEQHQAILTLARERQVSMSDIVREAIREFLATKSNLAATTG